VRPALKILAPAVLEEVVGGEPMKRPLGAAIGLGARYRAATPDMLDRYTSCVGDYDFFRDLWKVTRTGRRPGCDATLKREIWEGGEDMSPAEYARRTAPRE